ncbi:Uma2 family endonuclease [Planomonospora corallina]|uniref:Uma2 family endonuclease n=1 Tax=Planomonospora corallina TaxID=1806052 RepID=A0ABV8I2X7_9ACTN
MSAAPLSESELRPEPSVWDPLPDWAVPSVKGFVAEDLDRLPGIPPHTELIDGNLVFVSSQTRFHTRMLSLLERELSKAAPDHLRVEREMTVKLGRRQRPEPDLVVLHAHAAADLMRTFYEAADVLLAVEVVSEESEERDRKRKPFLYAEAGIPYFWRVEYESGRPAVYVHHLDPAVRGYALTGVHRDHLRLRLPFDLDIDLTEITRI